MMQLQYTHKLHHRQSQFSHFCSNDKIEVDGKKRKPVPARDGLPFVFSEQVFQAAFLQPVYAPARKMEALQREVSPVGSVSASKRFTL